jgi:hypothetical protein
MGMVGVSLEKAAVGALGTRNPDTFKMVEVLTRRRQDVHS